MFVEILKSWWCRGADPQAYYYRDRDGREIDLVLVKDRTIYPVEIKKTTRPAPSVAQTFRSLDRLGLKRGRGAVVCLTPDVLPLDRTTDAVPAGFV